MILLHDGSHRTPEGERGNSVRATDSILESLVADGHRFVTIPELVAGGLLARSYASLSAG